MALIDIDDEFLQLFYNITNLRPPANVELLDLKKQLINIALKRFMTLLINLKNVIILML